MCQQINTFNLTEVMPSCVYECQVKMDVRTYCVGSSIKYDISYYYEIPEGQPSGQDNPAHPFYQKRVDDVDGTKVIKNAVTQSMIEYLMMTDSELSQFTGTTTPKQYRKLLINALDSLWE